MNFRADIKFYQLLTLLHSKECSGKDTCFGWVENNFLKTLINNEEGLPIGQRGKGKFAFLNSSTQYTFNISAQNSI